MIEYSPVTGTLPNNAITWFTFLSPCSVILASSLTSEQHNQKKYVMKLLSNFFSLFIIIALAIICMQGKPKQHASMDLSEDELGCLVENVYHEARGEDTLG